MQIFGADFSGVKSPKGIWYARGELKDNIFTVLDVTPCDDRLDLLAAILRTCSPWGLDFPFSLPWEAMQHLGAETWSGLVSLVATMSREQFRDAFDNFPGGEGREVRCSGGNPWCRFTDAAVGGFSPLKKHNPGMVSMTYAGLKFLSYLRESGGGVYPFSKPDSGKPWVYEVYPAHVWKALKLKPNMDLPQELAEVDGIRIILRPKLPTRDAADATMACIGTAIGLANIGPWPTEQPSNVSQTEWTNRDTQGLVFR